MISEVCDSTYASAFTTAGLGIQSGLLPSKEFFAAPGSGSGRPIAERPAMERSPALLAFPGKTVFL
jgi:hypothetical protein